MRSHVQNILLELTCSQELRGRFYWPGIPSQLEHPNWHYIPSLCDAHTVAIKGFASAKTMPENGNKNKDEVLTRGRAIQCISNVCKYYGEDGYWQKEYEEPHRNCKGPHCQLQRDHINFNTWPCPFPKRHVGQRGKGKHKCKEEPYAPHKRAANMEEPIDIDMLINDGACLYISD